MSEPVGVQAERLRELAGKIRANAGSYGNEEFWKHLAFDAADGLDEQAEQIEQTEAEVARLARELRKYQHINESVRVCPAHTAEIVDGSGCWVCAAQDEREARRAALRQRDNLRDALRRLYETAAHDLIGYTSCAGCIAAHDADGEWWLTAAARDGHEEDCPYFAVQVARAALRAAAVGEDHRTNDNGGTTMALRSYEAGEAARMLGVDLFYLAAALRSASASRFKSEAERVTSYERPNLGQARALLRAAEACEAAYDEECAVRLGVGEETPK